MALKNKIYLPIISFGFLIIGLVNYYFSGNSILLFRILKITPFKMHHLEFVSSYLNDILFSIFLFLNILFLKGSISNYKLLFLPLILIILEGLQFYYPFLGTFDLFDVGVYIFFLIITIIYLYL
jgi:hypothetical protein